MTEVWKDVPDFEGLYQVSNFGNVRSLDVYVRTGLKNNSKVLHKGRMLKPMINKYGYVCVDLRKNTKRHTKTIHRIVAAAFIENHENKPCVNHLDGNKSNNNVNNLEWCSYSENIIHAFKTGLKHCKSGKEHHSRSEIFQCDLKGNIIKLWYGFHEVDRELGFDYRNIHACCNGKQPTAYGYKWRYANEQNSV